MRHEVPERARAAVLLDAECVCVSGRGDTTGSRDAIAARLRSPPRRHRGPRRPTTKVPTPRKAMADFMEEAKQYEARYEPVDDAEECAYIKLVNVGDKVITRRRGYLTSQLGYYLGQRAHPTSKNMARAAW